MPFPTRPEIHAILLNLSNPPSGTDEFFKHVHDHVIWTVTGHMMFSGTWSSKSTYRADTWAQLSPLIAEPGMKLEVVGGEQGVISGQDGLAVVELKTVDTRTKGGVVYDQHYAWHMRFNADGKIVGVRVFLDSAHLEKILDVERAKQDQEMVLEGSKTA
ncbi:hypothetical protein MMC14_007476 [Varicellaria rhodocarpa]|nr:hypothetical protein [Varicellaria rhodocarpa]